MSISNDSGQQHPQLQQAPDGAAEREQVAHSGEGAASALAQLKSQARQQRHQLGNSAGAEEGRAQ